MGTSCQAIEISKFKIPKEDSALITYIIHSGCTTHITLQHDIFSTYTPLQAGAMRLLSATGKTIDASGYGSIQFGHIMVEDIYYISTMYASLLSGRQLDR